MNDDSRTEDWTIVISCPQYNVLADFVDGNLEEKATIQIEDHIVQCNRCLDVLRSKDRTQSSRNPAHAFDLSVISMNPGNDNIVRQVLAYISTQLAAQEATVSNPRANANLQTAVAWLNPAESAMELGRVGKYRILRQIGRGGMGVVFEAEDTQLERRVAIKSIQGARDSDASLVRRFQREAQAIAGLKHPRIVAIHDYGIQNSVPYIVMEMLDGESLEDRLKRDSRLTFAEVLRIGIGLAEGLAAAHVKGLIHRDVKPANVWLEKYEAEFNSRNATDSEVDVVSTAHRVDRSQAIGSSILSASHLAGVKLLDFGLARDDSKDATITRPGTLLGSPCYMSPEQAAAGPLDHRTDLFSLGCVLYRMLTGRSPHVGDNVLAVLRSIAMEQPPRVQTLRPETPPNLGELVEQLLSKNPADRPESADAVVAKLKAIETTIEQGHTARLKTQPESAGTGSRKGGGGLSRRHVLAAGAGFLALLSVIIITVRDRNGKEWKFQGDSDSVESITIQTSDGSMTATANAGRTKTKSGEPAVADNARNTNDAAKSIPRVVQSLNHLRWEDIPKSEIIANQHKELVAVIGERRGKSWGGAMTMQFDPLGRFLLSQPDSEFPELWSLQDVSQLDTGDVIQSMPWSVANGANRGFSDDGSLLLSGSEIFSVEGETADTLKLKKLANLDVNSTSAIFSPDKRWILAAVDNMAAPNNFDQCLLYVFQFTENQPALKKRISVIDEQGEAVKLLGLQLVADGKLLVGTTHEQATPQRTLIWDFSWTDTGPELSNVRSMDGLWQYTDDGKSALQVEIGKTARLWDMSSPEPKMIHEFAEINYGCLSADGSVVAGGPLGGNSRVFIYSLHEGRWELQRFETGSNVLPVAISKDGKTVAAGCLDGCVRMFDLSEPVGHEINPPAPFTRITNAEISPDGTLLGTVGWDGAALFDLTTSPPMRIPESECDHGRDKFWSFSDEFQIAALSSGELFDVSIRPIKRIPSPADNHKIWLAASGKSLFEPDSQSNLSIRSWELTTRGQFRVGAVDRSIRVPLLHDGAFQSFFDPRKPRFVVPYHDGNGTDIFDLNSGASVYHSATPYLGRVSADGSLALLFWSGGYPGVVDLSETPPREYPLSISMGSTDGTFNNPGNRVIIASRQSIDFTDWVKNEVVYSIPMPGPVRYLRLHPDGQHVITVNANGTVYVLRLPDPI